MLNPSTAGCEAAISRAVLLEWVTQILCYAPRRTRPCPAQGLKRALPGIVGFLSSSQGRTTSEPQDYRTSESEEERSIVGKRGLACMQPDICAFGTWTCQRLF